MTKQERSIEELIQEELARRKKGNCPACNGSSHPLGASVITLGSLPESVQECDDCGGHFTTEPVTKAVAARIVKLGTLVSTAYLASDVRYFNVETAMGWSHGWMLKATGEVVQYG